jgi:hypothetical protein
MKTEHENKNMETEHGNKNLTEYEKKKKPWEWCQSQQGYKSP